MQTVLVHIDQSLGPIGAWGYQDGHLTHFYPESLDLAISGRARQVMACRDTDVLDWFRLVADTEPTMLDEYRIVETEDQVALVHVLSRFRRRWNAADNTS